jgi:glycosyltransferase involved in cell wall biosynthesis
MVKVAVFDPKWNKGFNGAWRSLQEIISASPEGLSCIWGPDADPNAIDCVWANSLLSLRQGKALASKADVPLVLSHRQNAPRHLAPALGNLLLTVDAFTAPSRFTAQSWEDLLGFPVTVIPNCVGPGFCPQAPMATELAQLKRNHPGRKILLFMARLRPEKGLLDILHILQQVEAMRPGDYHLAIVGRAEPMPQRFKSQLVNMRQRYPEISVSVHGISSHPERWLAHVDILLHPCIYDEVYGKVLLETMTCGTPVLASAKGGIPEFVPEPYLIKTRSPQAWAERIIRVSARRSMPHHSTGLSSSEVAQSWANFFKSILSK